MNLKVNLEKFPLKKGIAFMLAIATSATFVGCSKKSECDVSDNHIHKYVNAAGYVRYLDEERLSYGGYNWTNDYLIADDEGIELRNFEDKNNLIRIDENLENILKQQEKNQDYIEYQYTYMNYINKVFVKYYSWTTNPNHSRLTGKERVCHTMYQAYKIDKNEDGQEILVASKYVDDLTTIMEEYPYIKKDYSKVFKNELEYDAKYENSNEKTSKIMSIALRPINNNIK